MSDSHNDFLHHRWFCEEVRHDEVFTKWKLQQQ